MECLPPKNHSQKEGSIIHTYVYTNERESRSRGVDLGGLPMVCSALQNHSQKEGSIVHMYVHT
jgi:hypothetical protein